VQEQRGTKEWEYAQVLSQDPVNRLEMSYAVFELKGDIQPTKFQAYAAEILGRGAPGDRVLNHYRVKAVCRHSQNRIVVRNKLDCDIRLRT
jgi:hypothetical protein